MAKVPMTGLEGCCSEYTRAALAKDSSLVPSIHIRQLTTTYHTTPVPGGRIPLACKSTDLHMHITTHTHTIPKLLLNRNTTAYQVPTIHQYFSWIIALNLQNFCGPGGTEFNVQHTQKQIQVWQLMPIIQEPGRQTHTQCPWSLLARQLGRTGFRLRNLVLRKKIPLSSMHNHICMCMCTHTNSVRLMLLTAPTL